MYNSKFFFRYKNVCCPNLFCLFCNDKRNVLFWVLFIRCSLVECRWMNEELTQCLTVATVIPVVCCSLRLSPLCAPMDTFITAISFNSHWSIQRYVSDWKWGWWCPFKGEKCFHTHSTNSDQRQITNNYWVWIWLLWRAIRIDIEYIFYHTHTFRINILIFVAIDFFIVLIHMTWIQCMKMYQVAYFYMASIQLEF